MRLARPIFCELASRLAEIGVDQLLDLLLDLVGELVAVRAEQLDAVVVVGIVRGRDHHAEVGAHRARQHRDARRRDRAGQQHVHADRGEAGRQRVLDHVAGQARVLADQHAVAVVAVLEDEPDRLADLQREFRRDDAVGPAANAVGAEILASHQSPLRFGPVSGPSSSSLLGAMRRGRICRANAAQMPSKIVRDINGGRPPVAAARGRPYHAVTKLAIREASPCCAPQPLRLLVLPVELAAPPARADDWGVCKDENASADTAIEACTRIIKAGKTKGNDLAITYYNRAISYRQKNDNDSRARRLQRIDPHQSEIRQVVQQPRQCLEGQGRPRPRHRRLQRGDPARSEIRARLRQPRRRVGRQGRQQPRHRRPRPGDPARSEIFARLQRARRGVEEEGRPRPRARRLHRRDPPRPEIRDRLCQSRRRVGRQGRSGPRHRRPDRGDAHLAELRARLQHPRRDLPQPQRFRPRHRRLHRGGARRSEVHARLHQPRQCLQGPRRPGPRHRGLRRGDPHQSEIRRRLHAPLGSLAEEGRQHRGAARCRPGGQSRPERPGELRHARRP